MFNKFIYRFLAFILCAISTQLSAQETTTISIFGSKSATPVYSCPTGFTLTGLRCVKTVISEATPVYSCPTGQVLDGVNCIKTTVTNKPATPVYSCPGGFTLDGENCTKITSSNAKANN